MLCSRLAASQQARLTEQQTKGDMYWGFGSDCHLSNGCIEPHLVASEIMVSYQQSWTSLFTMQGIPDKSP